MVGVGVPTSFPVNPNIKIKNKILNKFLCMNGGKKNYKLLITMLSKQVVTMTLPPCFIIVNLF